MKKTKLLTILLPILALGGLASCGNKNDDEFEYECDTQYHWLKGDTETRTKHRFEDEPEKAIPSTCSVQGKTFKVCKDCGYESSKDSPFADHVLSVDSSLRVNSTCSEAGHDVEKCANCDYTHTIPLEKTAHTFGAGTEKTDGGKTFLEFECSTCHAKSNNLVAFNTVEVDGDTATSGKFPTTAGSFGSWKVSLPAGEYEVWFSAKFSSSGANLPFSGTDSRGIEVKFNGTTVEFDGTKTAENYGLSTSEYKQFTFFNITATGGNDVLELQNPYYRLVFDVASDIVFKPVAK